jgi:hypothetical protein
MINRQVFFGLLFSSLLLCIPMLAWAQDDMDEDTVMGLYFGGVFILVIGVFFLIIWLGRKENKQDEAMKVKIKELRNQGKELHLNRTEPLAAEDIQYLEKYSNMSVMAVTIIFAVIAILFFVFGNFIFYALGAGMLILIIPTRKYIRSGMQAVMDKGQKQVIRGLITDRYTTTTGTAKSQTTHYWLKLGDITLQVNSSKYGTYAVGDAAEFHTIDYPAGKIFIIRDSKLEGAGLR